MKRFSPLLILILALVLALPTTVFAQDVSGLSIEDIASSVVLIETIEGNSGIATGTGTIISPDGIIYTNRHVIEDGDDFAIYMLDDIRELPSLRYYASLQYVSSNIDVDFAILQIDRDRNGRAINAANEALPYLPTTSASTDVSVGERIRIFGYPGIGDGYMVTTTGEVVTIQNGSIGGDRMPVWYWTDAEISGGNSGGLAVNEAGEWLGLPTWVVSEDRTAGRLGGLLPLGAVQATLINDGYVPGTDYVPDTSTFNADAGDANGAGTFMLVNTSSATICYVYISPSDASDWGDDQLAATEVVSSGNSRAFNILPGMYDMLLQDCDRETLQDTRSISVAQGMTATFDGSTLLLDVASTGGGGGTLTIENKSSITICYVYISPSDSDTWGNDQLGEREVVQGGANRTWEVEANTYDVLLQDCEGETLDDIRGINISDDYIISYK